MDNNLEGILKSIKGLSLENKREILHFLQNDETVVPSCPGEIGNLLKDFVPAIRSKFELKLKGT